MNRGKSTARSRTLRKRSVSSSTSSPTAAPATTVARRRRATSAKPRRQSALNNLPQSSRPTPLAPSQQSLPTSSRLTGVREPAQLISRRNFSSVGGDQGIVPQDPEAARQAAFTRTESPHNYTQPVELGPEYLDEPDETRNETLNTNLHSLLHGKYNFGFKSYGEVISSATDDGGRLKFSGPNMIDTEELEKRFQRQQNLEEAHSRRAMHQMTVEAQQEIAERDNQSRILAQAQLEEQMNHEAKVLAAQRQLDEEMGMTAPKSSRGGLRPIRMTMPAEIKRLSALLVNEARSRGLDEQGDRPAGSINAAEIVMDDDGNAHSSMTRVKIDNQDYTLAEIPDKRLIAEIIRISMDWNRSGPRNKPLETTDLSYSNKAKLEEGVSPYFSADKGRGGRDFTYGRFIDSVEKAAREDNAGPPTTTSATHHHSTRRPIGAPLTSLDSEPSYQPGFENTLNRDGNDDGGDHNDGANDEPLAPLPSLPHGIAMPSNLSNIIKDASPYKELQVTKPTVSLNDKIASNSKELANQLIHRDFLHNSIVRRKPRGKLTELELRDALVDAERAHSLPVIFDHYDISMLSLFEETGNAQAISVAADVIGGFTPVFLKVKTDFDPTFVRMIQLLHEQQRMADEAAEELPETTFAGISDPFASAPGQPRQSAEKRTQKRNEAERKHLEFLNRLLQTDKDGCSTLHKDDVLIPDFPDSVIQMILSETLDKQVAEEDGFAGTGHSSTRKARSADGRVGANDDDDEDGDGGARIDHSMRDSMMKEMLVFKGKTIGELHQMGCFNKNPYDDVSQAEYVPGSERNDFDEGGQRNRYAFTDDMKHMHRWTAEREAALHHTSLFGGKAGDDAKSVYVQRLNRRDNKFREQAQKSRIPLMTETGGFISPAASAEAKNYRPFYGKPGQERDEAQTAGAASDDGGGGRGAEAPILPGIQAPALETISRFAQLAMASSVISKYGSLDANFRNATGIDMNKIDELIIDALDQGDVPIKAMSAKDRHNYLADLKRDALDFPRRSFEAMVDQTHVPYLTTGRFQKIPSKYFGAWDYETALNGVYLEQIGIRNAHVERIGPYHPMFLVVVGGRGFTNENSWDISELREMLRGDIDERPEVIARRTAAWMKKHPGKDPKVYRPFEARLAYVPPSEADIARKYDPLGYTELDDNRLTQNDVDMMQRQQHAALQNQMALEQQRAQQRHPMPTGGNAFFDDLYKRSAQITQEREATEQAQAKKALTQALDDIPEILDDEDAEHFDAAFAQKHQETQEQLRLQLEEQAKVANDLGKNRPQLPRNYPQLHDVVENSDPNQITFNTSNMTELHKTHEVNEFDIKQSSENILSTAELTYRFAKSVEEEAMADPNDVSHKLRLRYFVDNEFQASKAERLAREIDGDYTGEIRAPQSAEVVQDFSLDRTKPDPFSADTPENLKIDIQNPQHELFGGPITVQHFLTSMAGTDEGRGIARQIEQEHREFLGDDVYERAVKSASAAAATTTSPVDQFKSEISPKPKM